MNNKDNNSNRRIIDSGRQKKSGQDDKGMEKGMVTPVPSYKPKPSQPKPSQPKPSSKK
jgi:hypothetical protein